MPPPSSPLPGSGSSAGGTCRRTSSMSGTSSPRSPPSGPPSSLGVSARSDSSQQLETLAVNRCCRRREQDNPGVCLPVQADPAAEPARAAVVPGDPAPLGVKGEPGGADADCRTGEVRHRVQGGPARGGAVQERPGEPGEVLDGGTDTAGRRQRLAGPGLPGLAPAAVCRSGRPGPVRRGLQACRTIRAPTARRGVPPQVPDSSSPHRPRSRGRGVRTRSWNTAAGASAAGPRNRTARACSSSSAEALPIRVSRRAGKVTPCAPAWTRNRALPGPTGAARRHAGSRSQDWRPPQRSCPAGAVHRAALSGEISPRPHASA